MVLKVKEANGGEADNALATLKKMCNKYELDLDEVLNGEAKKTDRIFEVRLKERQIAIQVILRYGGTREIYGSRGSRNVVIVALDEAHYLEVKHALEVLLPVWKKELEKVIDAAKSGFCYKHDLYYKGTDEAEGKKLTPAEEREQQRRAIRGARLAEDMDDAEVLKRLA